GVLSLLCSWRTVIFHKPTPESPQRGEVGRGKSLHRTRPWPPSCLPPLGGGTTYWVRLLVGMDQRHLALALAVFQQAVRLWGLLAGKDFRDIGIDRPAGNQRYQIGHAARPHVGLTIGIKHTKPRPAQALGP